VVYVKNAVKIYAKIAEFYAYHVMNIIVIHVYQNAQFVILIYVPIVF
jgi:hypothetical protein